jgi:hypothetical protein
MKATVGSSPPCALDESSISHQPNLYRSGIREVTQKLVELQRHAVA